MNEVEESQNLREIAQRLLDKTSVVKFIEPLGEVVFTGSFAYDLMTWPDIDIAVYAESFSMETISSATGNLMKNVELIWLKFTDYTRTKGENGFPRGIYLGTKYIFEDREWKVDAWLIRNNDKRTEDEFSDKFFEELTKQQRKAILKLKFELIRQSRYPGKREISNSVSSADLYRAVKRGVSSVDNLDTWLKK